MKRILLMIVFGVISYGVVFSQTDGEKKSAFQFSFIPFMSTNGPQAKEYTNCASFNLLVGVSKNEKVFTFAGLSNIILNDATGFQFAGLTNYVGNTGNGMQLAGLMNITKSNYSGFQFAGLGNVAGDVTGFQFAGLINVARQVRGVQFAGLINVAEDSDCPIGFVNIIKNGEMGIAMTYDSNGSVVASFRSGGRYTYGILGVGYNHRTTGNVFVTEGGLGVHIPCLSWFRINNEIKVSSIGSSSQNPVISGGYSLLPAFRIGGHCEIFGGASINYTSMDDVDELISRPNHTLWKKQGSSKYQGIGITYQAGIQYIF